MVLSHGWFVVPRLVIDIWYIRPITQYDTLSRDLNDCTGNQRDHLGKGKQLVSEEKNVIIRRQRKSISLEPSD